MLYMSTCLTRTTIFTFVRRSKPCDKQDYYTIREFRVM